MVRPEQVLILDPPAELHFQAPFNDIVKTNLKLTNPTDTRVCFKIKTTAPRTYCVRPNYGLIEPKKSITVNLMLQPADLEITEQSKHKFMVQSTFAPDEDLDVENAVWSMDKIWNETPAENFMSSKLICVFDPSESEVQALKTKKNVDSVRKHQNVVSEAVFEVPEAVDTASEVKTKAKEANDNDVNMELVMKQNKAFASEVLKMKQENLALKTKAKEANDNDVNDDVNMELVMKQNKALAAEVLKMKQENSALKEESLRLRVSNAASEAKAHAAQSKPPVQKASHLSKEFSPVLTYITYFLVLLFAIYCGKVFL